MAEGQYNQFVHRTIITNNHDLVAAVTVSSKRNHQDNHFRHRLPPYGHSHFTFPNFQGCHHAHTHTERQSKRELFRSNVIGVVERGRYSDQNWKNTSLTFAISHPPPLSSIHLTLLSPTYQSPPSFCLLSLRPSPSVCRIISLYYLPLLYLLVFISVLFSLFNLFTSLFLPLIISYLLPF